MSRPIPFFMALTASAWLFLYLLHAFVQWDLDPGAWTWVARFCCAFFSGLAAVYAAVGAFVKGLP